MGVPFQPWISMRLLVVNLLKLLRRKETKSCLNKEANTESEEAILEECTVWNALSVFRYACTMHFFILPVKKNLVRKKPCVYMQRYDSTIPALTFRIFLFWGGSWEGRSKPLNFSAGNPSSLHPFYVKNPAWAPATTLRWFQPKRRLKDKKVVMQICWMWGAMVKHLCNHLQYIYIYANYDILTSFIFIIWHANCFLLRF